MRAIGLLGNDLRSTETVAALRRGMFAVVDVMAKPAILPFIRIKEKLNIHQLDTNRSLTVWHN